MKWSTRAIFIAILAYSCAFAYAADRFQMDISPVFKGVDSRTMSTIALRVQVENKGADTRGVVELHGTSYEMRYPIDLPSGAKKSFLAYAPATYEQTTFTLNTPEGSIQRFYVTTGFSAAAYIGMVSDTEGLLSSIRKLRNENQGRVRGDVRDVYAKPGELPDRGAGLEILRALFLGDGSERLQDSEVRAIQEYVLRGGTLVVCGGASAPVLKDPRWQALLPVRDCQAKTVPEVTFLVDGNASTLAGPVTAMAGTPADGAHVLSGKDFPLVAKRTFGSGRVIFIAINPFEAPANRWSGVGDVLSSLVPIDASEPTNYLRHMGGWFNGGMDSYYSYSSYPSGMPPPPSVDSGNPFNVKMPAFGTVLGVLLVYFILIVPINLLVLRKLGKGEWAWITSPIISLVFAGIFFRFAGSLYSAERARSNQGLIVADADSPEAVVFGTSQLYFPTGGAYDLGMKGVTMLGGEERNGYRGFSERSVSVFDTLNPIDNGEIVLPQVQAGNLSFYQFSYEQRLSLGRVLETNFTVRPDGTLRGSIRNVGKYPLQQAVLWYNRRPYQLNVIDPQKEVALPAAGPKLADGQYYNSDVAAGVFSQGRLMLESKVVGAPVGPTIGKDMSPGAIKMLLFLHLRGKQS